MSKFVKFFAEGVIYKKDKNDRVCDILDFRSGSGVTLDNAELMGKVFTQCPDLIPCDRVAVRTMPIG